jgi:hypothetical protein
VLSVVRRGVCFLLGRESLAYGQTLARLLATHYAVYTCGQDIGLVVKRIVIACLRIEILFSGGAWMMRRQKKFMADGARQHWIGGVAAWPFYTSVFSSLANCNLFLDRQHASCEDVSTASSTLCLIHRFLCLAIAFGCAYISCPVNRFPSACI